MMKLLYVISFLLFTTINCFAQKIDVKTYSLEQALTANPDTIFALDLSHMKLDTVPSDIAKFTHLTYLDLSKNKLSKLPDFLSELENLKTVNISKLSLIHI